MKFDAIQTMPTLIVDVQVTGTWRVSLAFRLLRVARWLLRGKLMISTEDGIDIVTPKHLLGGSPS
jgi:hypothetical protein